MGFILGTAAATTATSTGTVVGMGTTAAAAEAAVAEAASAATAASVAGGAAASGFSAIEALSLGNMLFSGMSAYQQAEQQKTIQKEYNNQLKEQAINQYTELDKSESDILHNEFAKSLQAKEVALKARSEVEVQSAATGTYGNSIDIAISDINAGLENRLSDIILKKDRQMDQVQNQAKDIRAGTRTNADRTIQQPSWYKGLSAGFGAYEKTNKVGNLLKKTYKESRTIS